VEQYNGSDPKKQIFAIEANSDDWIMESIIASRSSDDDSKRHVFLVKLKDSAQEENMLETYENVAENNLELLEDYYEKNLAVERDGRCK
jgi:hypothetical protein